MLGGVLSCIVTKKKHRSEFMALSVATQLTVPVPSVKLAPEAGLQMIVTLEAPVLSVALITHVT